jgi:hypothetical protein
MGYCVSYDIEATMKKEHEAAALAAINALHDPDLVWGKGTGGSWSGGVRTAAYYAWTDNPPEGGFTSLEEALNAWRFETDDDCGGCLSFSFSGEKCGQEEVLFKALAPFLEGDIYGRGEDDAEWGYRFRDGMMIELFCEKTWSES